MKVGIKIISLIYWAAAELSSKNEITNTTLQKNKQTKKIIFKKMGRQMEKRKRTQIMILKKR